jgi:hypothetical protein
MAIEKIRAQISASVWQGIAQSGVDLSAVPHSDQEKLVSAVSERMLVAFNGLLDEEMNREAPEPPAAKTDASQAAVEIPVDEHGEQILWQGRPFLALNESYVLTSERIKIIRGLLSRNVENYELVRIQDIDLNQNVGERMLGIGDITIAGHDASKPKITLRDIHDPEGVYEILRRSWMESRKRHGLQFREQM